MKILFFRVVPLIALGFVILAGCSSQEEKTADEEWSDDIESSDTNSAEAAAQTDAVPEDTAETQSEEQVASNDSELPPEQTEAQPQPEATDVVTETAQETETPLETQQSETPVIPETPVNSIANHTETPVVPSQAVAEGEIQNYSIHSGDTLMKIAYELYGDIYQWRKIYDLNRDVLTNPNQITQGINLKLEKPTAPTDRIGNGEKYKIQAGDTLGKISNKLYGTPSKWRDLWNNNKGLIKNPNRIFAGFYLYYIPETGIATQGATESNRVPGSESATESPEF